MISLDWKERLKKDTCDFFERKLPAKEYDIDIIYNAYPERIDNKIPQAVITFVAKTIAQRLAKEPEKYLEFYDYILEHKGEQGKIIFAYIMARAIKKKPEIFLSYLEEILFKIEDQKECNLVIDKAIFPLFKKDVRAHLDRIMRWIKKDNPFLNLSLQKMIIKLINADPQLARQIFKKLENTWLYASPNMIKLNIAVLKAIYKIDSDLYHEIFSHYQVTRNPIYADILCNSILCCDEVTQQMVEKWCKSGNVKLKKLGQHGKKLLKRRKN